MRTTANALFSFLLAAGLAAQTPPPSAQPVSAQEKALQVLAAAGVTSIDCSSNLTAFAQCVGGPITTTGAFLLQFQTQNANSFFMGPVSGAAALPTFRALVAADAIGAHVPFRLCSAATPAGGNVDGDVVSTAAEEVLWSCLVPGNTLGTDGVLDIYVAFDWLRNNATGDSATWRFKVGCADGTTAACGAGQKLYEANINGGGALTLSASRFQGESEIHLQEAGANNSQACEIRFMTSVRQAAPTGDGILDYASGPQVAARIVQCAAGTVSTTADMYVMITFQHGASSANNSFRHRFSYAGVIR